MLFAKSAMRVQSMRLQKIAWITHVAAQGSTKQVRQLVNKLYPEKELGRDELLRDFKRRDNREE